MMTANIVQTVEEKKEDGDVMFQKVVEDVNGEFDKDDNVNDKDKEDLASLSKAVESDDVEPKAAVTVWTTLWNSLNPATCLSPAVACTNVLLEDDEMVDYAKTVPPMLRDIKHAGKARTSALQKLYRFTDRDHSKNRVPVVNSTRFHTLEALIPCLATVDVAPHDRRQALLVLNNLCIPSENKRTMLLGPSRDVLLTALLEILKQRLPECHLVVASLFNLSFYEETKDMLINYVPAVSTSSSSSSSKNNNPNKTSDSNDAPEAYTFSQPTEKKDSLLRILEKTVQDFVPYYLKHCELVNSAHAAAVAANKIGKLPTPPPSVEAATLRWSMCLLRNLATDADRATMLATTTSLPGAALQVLKITAELTDLSQWSHDSLPEACLVFWVWLVQASSHEACMYLGQVFGKGSDDQVSSLSAISVLEPITKEPGIQGVRAKMVSERLRTIAATSSSSMEMATGSKAIVDDLEAMEERLKTMASF